MGPGWADVEGDQQDKRASPGRAPSPHSFSLSHITALSFVKNILHGHGLKKVERECNKLGKNSHFLVKVCFVCFGWKKVHQKEKLYSIFPHRYYVVLVTP